jgi:uncharacterized protein YdiU (UPF0061 family)
MMRSKLGLTIQDKNDASLVMNLEDCLMLSETDMTIFFRLLSKYKQGEIENAVNRIEDAFYKPEEIKDAILIQWKDWFTSYDQRLQIEVTSDEERSKMMNLVNPKYVLRNYMAQLAIDDANKGNYQLIDELFNLLKKPYDEQPQSEKWFAKRPEWARHKVGCSMLSCSS